MSVTNNLTEGFFQDEIRQGYHITAEMKKVWAVELELLNELDRVCKKLNIKYYLDSGTLLGAVRDGRFIPWDDDIDTIMMRSDYDVLAEKGKDLFDDEYFFQCAYTDTDYPRGHAQLRKKGTCAMIPYEARHVKFDQSIFIDIFVLDGVATDEKNIREQFKRKGKIMWKMETIGIPASTIPLNTAIKKVLRFFYRFTSPSMGEMFAEYEKICKQYNNSEYVDKIMFRESTDAIIPLRREWFSDSIEMAFESGRFPVPVKYKEVLKSYYGDNYMIPSKAPSAHGSTILDDQRSFRDVLNTMGHKKLH